MPSPAEPLAVAAPAAARPIIEPLLADLTQAGSIALAWFADADEALALAPTAQAAWFDPLPFQERRAILEAAPRLQWLSTMSAGLEALPLDLLRERGVLLTNGSGLNSPSVADYAVMGLLSLAKGFPDVVRAQDRREWLTVAPNTAELEGSRALILGYGTIGRAIADRLRPFAVEVTGVRRTADPANGVLGTEDWRACLGDYDWIVIAAPATDATTHMIGGAELAAMKPTAGIVNIARGHLIDQPALIAALTEKRIAGAFLDVTIPEPLPPDDPLWTAPNCTITMHLSGRSQTSMFRRAAERFATNLRRYAQGEPLSHVADLGLGY